MNDWKKKIEIVLWFPIHSFMRKYILRIYSLSGDLLKVLLGDDRLLDKSLRRRLSESGIGDGLRNGLLIDNKSLRLDRLDELGLINWLLINNIVGDLFGFSSLGIEGDSSDGSD